MYARQISSGIRDHKRANPVSATELGLVEMISFGNKLREAREERAVSLDAIAEDTRIGRRFLDALERGDLEALPGGPFDKGYIRSYAEFLGIEPQPFLDAYSAETRARATQESDEEMLAEFSRLADQQSRTNHRGGTRSRSRGMRFVLALASLALMAGIGWYIFRGTATSENTPPLIEVSEPPAAPPRTAIAMPTDSSAPAADNSDLLPEAEAPPTPEPPSAERPTEMASSPTTSSDPPSPKQTEPQEPPPSAPSDVSRLTVSGFGVGTNIVERVLVGKNDRFQEGTTVWFWTRVVGGNNGDVLRHFWLYEGRTVRLSELTVGGHHWRTHSNYTIPPGSTGNYVVEARGPDGRVLARQEFVCLPTQKAQIQR